MQSFDSKSLYNRWTVTIQVRDRLFGGIPRNPELIEAHVKAKTGHDDELTKNQVEVLTEQMIDQVAEKSWIGFCRDPEQGVWIHARNVKASIKQCASILGILKAKRGSKQIVCEGLEVKGTVNPDRLYLGKDAADGYEEKPIHVMTAQGPRTALKRADFVERPALTFEIWVLRTAPQETRHIGEKELVQILTFAQENGVGADRSQGAGKFDVTHFAAIEEV